MLVWSFVFPLKGFFYMNAGKQILPVHPNKDYFLIFYFYFHTSPVNVMGDK